MRRAALLLIIGASTQACFASRSDFDVLQGDVSNIRQRDAASDSLQREQLARISRSISAMSDSLRALNGRLASANSRTASEIADLRQDVAQLQDLTGQSQQRLNELRATLESRPAVPAAPSDTAPAETQPGPAQLLQIGRDLSLKRSYSSARTAFTGLLETYPTSDLAPEAAFEIAQAYNAEKNFPAADSSYARVVSDYASSPLVPTALYKRALIAQERGRTSSARTLFNEVIRRFPRSNEAALARERLSSGR